MTRRGYYQSEVWLEVIEVLDQPKKHQITPIHIEYSRRLKLSDGKVHSVKFTTKQEAEKVEESDKVKVWKNK